MCNYNILPFHFNISLYNKDQNNIFLYILPNNLYIKNNNELTENTND
jgi:hypothetical protein